MEFRKFNFENVHRCELRDGFNHKIKDWSLSDWAVATLGELGEAANVVKKINRHRDGVTNVGDPAPDVLLAQLRDEIADTFIYLDLFATAAGFSLEDAVREKWNKTSEKIGYPVLLGVR